MLSFIVVGCAVAFTIIIVVTAIGHFLVSTPYGGTPPAIMRAMVRLAALQPGDRVCDIGAGDGRILIEAKRSCPSIEAFGYEIALAIWLWGKLRIRASRLPIRLKLRNALHDDLSSVDVLFLYVGPEMMRALLPKLERELRPGSRVVSHVFRFHGREPVITEQVSAGRRTKSVHLYHF